MPQVAEHDIETTKVNDKVTRVKADKVPCKGGPLNHLMIHRPYERLVPLSDGRYRLVDGPNPYYQYEPEGRRRLGSGPDQ